MGCLFFFSLCTFFLLSSLGTSRIQDNTKTPPTPRFEREAAAVSHVVSGGPPVKCIVCIMIKIMGILYATSEANKLPPLPLPSVYGIALEQSTSALTFATPSSDRRKYAPA